jgi:hypothetical protein
VGNRRYDQASQLIVGLSGASVESQGEDELVISVVPRTVEGLETERKYRLTVRFNPREDMALESLAVPRTHARNTHTHDTRHTTQ